MKKLLMILTLFGIILLNLNEVSGFNEGDPDTSSAKKVLIKGTVLDSISHEPLTGALIQTDGTQVYSDFNGNFKLQVPNNDSISISLISYKDKKIHFKKILYSKDSLTFRLNQVK